MKKLILLWTLLLVHTSVFAIKNISQKHANERGERVSELEYKLSLDLTKVDEIFTGSTEIAFVLGKNKKDLVLDFRGRSVESLVINGSHVEIESFVQDNDSIGLPGKYLKTGQNIVSIKYTGEYSNDGTGLHKFVDPKDGEVYVYTDFQPANAHRLFPGFDQPDLKATFSIDVKASDKWEIVSNGLPVKTHSENGIKHIYFKKTKPITTYVAHVSAGPYQRWEDNSFKYPLKIYARKSLAQYMDAERIFDTTKKGFEFFEDYYDMDYPFEKYDQLFVPEYGAGAMENVAAVTFRESMIFRNTPSEINLADRDVTILHELAHMWFGNIVTMKWWNDLWLNESFADFMGYYGLAGIGYDKAWEMSSGRKRWAYYEDQLMTTHPILAEIKDIEAANQNFDGITYAKGLAVVRQLQYKIGDRAFRDGIRYYLKKNAFKNTTLDEFISALEKSYGSELDDWVYSWLGTADVNTMQVETEHKNGIITKATVYQYPGRSNQVLRSHSNQLGLYYVDNDKLVLKEKIKIHFNGEKTEINQLVGKKQPVMIVPNIDDYDYVKGRFDTASLNWLKENIHLVTDTTTKNNVWLYLWDMVRDQELKAGELFELIVKQLPFETDANIFRSIRGYAIQIADIYTVDESLADKRRNVLFNLAKNHINKVKTGTDLHRYWYGLIIQSAAKADELDYLVALFDGTEIIPGIEIYNARKWSILNTLISRERVADVDKRKDLLIKEDPSASAQNQLLRINYSYPNKVKKQEIWDNLTRKSKYSLRQKQFLSGGLYNQRHKELTDSYVDEYFQQAKKMIVMKDEYFKTSVFLQLAFPLLGAEKTVVNAREFISNPDIPMNYRKIVMKPLDELERILKIREYNQ